MTPAMNLTSRNQDKRRCLIITSLLWIWRTHLENKQNIPLTAEYEAELPPESCFEHALVCKHLRCLGQSTGARWACPTLRASSLALETGRKLLCCLHSHWEEKETINLGNWENSRSIDGKRENWSRAGIRTKLERAISGPISAFRAFCFFPVWLDIRLLPPCFHTVLQHFSSYFPSLDLRFSDYGRVFWLNSYLVILELAQTHPVGQIL